MISHIDGLLACNASILNDNMQPPHPKSNCDCSPSSQINAQDLSGQTPLHLACERGDLMCVKELLEESQARTDVKDRKGETPMHFAAKLDSPVIAQVQIITLSISSQGHFHLQSG